MDVLIYNELANQKIMGLDKLIAYLQDDNFKSAEVKKIQPNLYRAKLNRSDRILFSVYQYQQKNYILILEYLKNHDYQGSRFLNEDVQINEAEIPDVESIDEMEAQEQLVYINANNPNFVYLNKFISFDDVQQHIYKQYPPLVIIGSAGSGKTAILLEKMKQLEGQILYVTLSSFLVKNSRELYYSDQYYNDRQLVDFYSYQDFIESIAIPEHAFADIEFFRTWYKKHYKNSFNAHSIYEEFKGVLTGAMTDQAYLSEQDYLNLGIKQSIFSVEERTEVYRIFQHYLTELKKNNLSDINILSFEYLQKVKPAYDYVVIDEVQDITAIQLYLILNSLSDKGLFLMCGDANQIVHPNFFSWAKVKSLFHRHEELHHGMEITHILQHNYRNAQRITEISNRVLLLKNARFGSIDKESHYLVRSNADIQGGVYFLKNRPEILHELDQKTAVSTQFAVIVMHEEQKKTAQRVFKTPLVFSIQEAKGLEYQNIILYNFVSQSAAHFNEICGEISLQDLQSDFVYARNKDKADKSLEIYKFYINALYVGLTRAMSNIYWVEQQDQHQIFHLLGMDQAAEVLDLQDQQSSLKEWQKEAQKLELQGKKEQAERIRREILKEESPNWVVLKDSELRHLEHRALQDKDKKSQLALFEYAVVYQHQAYLIQLAKIGFKPAISVFNMRHEVVAHKAEQGILSKYYMNYQVKHPTALLKKIEKFGINHRNEFNQTPLMAAVWVGNGAFYQQLLQDGADVGLLDGHGLNVLQIALQRVTIQPKYAANLTDIAAYLPQDSIVLQISQRLFKLESHDAEYMIFQLMYVMSMIQGYQRYAHDEKGFDSAVLLENLEKISGTLFAKKKLKRSYISSLLSKNETTGSDKYNKHLFIRTGRGQYLLNPELVIKVNGEWQPIYQSMNVQRVDFYMDEPEVPELANNQHWQDKLKQINQFNRNRTLAFFDVIGRKDGAKIETEL
ncbi:UvrD-helicase domain-containing protein [Acinetobacter sp. 251-1]|uniref:UvrD-helicase domain-containing protein n=1 Tax=Acinetobacter TaxID=469 RepID=UPI002575CBEA|nr:UvrD-helicase domain-containing protein [Acinetobacter sp. 251-1]MDM1760436.1 AAA family ATPase [Acinetobacter sp. 251-1]